MRLARPAKGTGTQRSVCVAFSRVSPERRFTQAHSRTIPYCAAVVASISCAAQIKLCLKALAVPLAENRRKKEAPPIGNSRPPPGCADTKRPPRNRVIRKFFAGVFPKAKQSLPKQSKLSAPLP